MGSRVIAATAAATTLAVVVSGTTVGRDSSPAPPTEEPVIDDVLCLTLTGSAPPLKMWDGTTLAGTVVLALLGGLSSVVLAQEASPPASPSASPAPTAMAAAVFTGEDTGDWRVSDPRVSGPCTETWDGEVGFPAEAEGVLTYGFVAGGILTLDGLDGDWVGPWAGMFGSDFPTVYRIFVTLEGTEAYEGWAVVAWVTTPEGWRVGTPQEGEGVIYEGSAPRLEWPEPPAG